MKKTLSKVLTVTLLITLILSTFPQNAYAAITDPLTNRYQLIYNNQSMDSDPAVPAVNPITKTEPSILGEDTSKRTEFSKQFIRSDSSRLMVIYPEAVHYKKGGKWQDIDNTLKQAKDSSGNDVLENTANSVDIKLPASFAPGKPVSLTKDGYTLQFMMEGTYAAESSSIQAPNAGLAQRMTSVQKKTISTKLDSKVIYSNVLPDIDFQYLVESQELKESVIVKSLPTTPLTYTYSVTADKLDPVLEKDNSINFYPRGKTDGVPVFVMPAPVMVDANGEVNYDVLITLDTTGGNCQITYAPSMTWMSDSARVWPIIIDPVVVANLDINNIKDQQVDSNNNTSYKSMFIEAGYNTTYGKERVYLMYQNLPALSSADVVVDAYIQIDHPYSSATATQMEVHKVNTTWDDTTLQWSNQPSFNTSIDDYQMVSDTGWYTWHITDIARGWYAGSNTGMIFKMPDSVENGTASNNRTFYSSDNNPGYQPILYITFRNNCGIEDYWNYHNQDIGRAGTGYVNDFTGNLVMEHNDIGITGNILPVSIQHFYNANDKSTNTFGCGYGWRTNYDQKVYKWSLDSSYYVWEDEDGTRHYFPYSGTSHIYKDEDGLNLTLNDNETGNYLYSITDNLGNIKYFDSNGRLARIQNNQANAGHIDITYTAASVPYIDTITDGAGRVYKYIYSGTNLIRIDYMGTGSTALQNIQFAYNGNTELSTITYYDTKTTTYQYTTSTVNHLLTRATDIDGYYVSYSYYNQTSTNIPNRINQIKYYDNAVAGDTLTCVYSHNQTSFTDSRSRVTIEQFNDMGNTTCVQDDQGNAQNASYAKDTDGDSGIANQLTLSPKLQNTVTNFLENGSAEYTDAWALSTGGTPGGSWSYSTTKYSGVKSIGITRTDEAGSYYRIQQTMTLAKGKTYTFSAWVKTTGMSSTGTGTYLQIQNQDTQGHWASAGSEIIKTSTLSSDPNTDSNGWRRVEATYTIPSNAYTGFVTLSMYQGTIGTAYYDCLQVEEAPTPSRYNLLENSDFAYQGSSSTTAQYWTTSGLISSDIRTTLNPSGCAKLDINCYKSSETQARRNLSARL